MMIEVRKNSRAINFLYSRNVNSKKTFLNEGAFRKPLSKKPCTLNVTCCFFADIVFFAKNSNFSKKNMVEKAKQTVLLVSQ